MILKLQMIKGRLTGGNLGMKISWACCLWDRSQVSCLDLFDYYAVLWFVGNNRRPYLGMRFQKFK